MKVKRLKVWDFSLELTFGRVLAFGKILVFSLILAFGKILDFVSGQVSGKFNFWNLQFLEPLLFGKALLSGSVFRKNLMKFTYFFGM